MSAVDREETAVGLFLVVAVSKKPKFAFMWMKKISRHLLFWISYTVILLYNELFLSASFSKDPGMDLFLQVLVAHLILLLVKIPLVYFISGSILPAWFQNRNNRVLLIFKMILAFISAVVLYRVLIHRSSGPLFMGKIREMPVLQFIARILYSVMDLLLVVAVASAIQLLIHRRNQDRKEKELIRERLQAELMQLKAQVNPHFLFNSLNTIYALIKSNPAIAGNAVIMLSTIMRYLLHGTKSGRVLLSEELEMLKNYTDLQQLRFGNRITIEFDTFGIHEQAMIAPVILLSLVENAFKHGTHADPESPIVIRFKLLLENDVLIFSSQNPLPIRKVESDSGIGLKNLHRQLSLLYLIMI
ncbi:MAG: histidine kinase [Bacteroidetes bacterium]|nr:histidine kinase [Bacteroidota bacterium]